MLVVERVEGCARGFGVGTSQRGHALVVRRRNSATHGSLRIRGATNAAFWIDMPSPDISTARLKLSLLGADDRALYRQLFADVDVMSTVGTPWKQQQADDAFARVVAHNTRATPGSRCWAIFDRNGAAIGISALNRLGERAEYGIMLLPIAWRQGYSVEVFAGLLPFAFGAMNLRAIDVRRPDDGQAPVLDGMFRPFGFVRHPTDALGNAHWSLEREAYALSGTVDGFNCNTAASR